MEKGGLPQLDTTWYPSQLFWLAVTFLFLYVIMSRFIVPRIHEVLETRQDRISHDLDWAASLKGDAEQAQDTYETALSDARSKAQVMLSSVMESIKEATESKHHELDEMLSETIATAEEQIAAATAKAQENLAPITQEITTLMVHTLLQGEATQDVINEAVAKAQKEFVA